MGYPLMQAGRVLVALGALTAATVASAADGEGAQAAQRAEAVRTCASDEKVPAEDVDACAERLVQKWNDPAFQSMKAEARRVADGMLKGCPQVGDAFSACARRLNTAKSRESRDMAEAYANVDMWARDRQRDESKKAQILRSCEKAGIPRGNVTIGMTADQVKECGWGKPNYVNRTITKSTVTEQWVYGDGVYLYIRDGKLVAIQD